ncbi:hypothetical protein PFICI_03526 [Pestalotiopsis fici W106-1]|uniref:Uncharacterized protein n=1 Tax=Pestalotiopsis fici (strain W106-1 / CGMCC3.15140) TaxID=1229662 RepID=W3XJR7_PESFW|nr:uncharacterized protein PFICI_03526 [Pestalotiopsis fici W106-1]ETS85501.1 hypothetical protein PFICI_03526 [Pestalotiopsis fici W106-1]
MDSSTRPPSVEAMKIVISRALPGVSVESIQPLSSIRPQRDARVKVSSGRNLVLTIPPAPMIRLLRSEQWLVLSEALLISWICRRAPSISPLATKDQRISIQSLTNLGPFQNDQPITQLQPEILVWPELVDTPLFRYLPELIAHSPLSHDLGVAFNLTEPSRGSVISLLSPPLSEEERVDLDYQKGQFIRLMTTLKAPNSKFGPAVAVIGQQGPLSDSSSAAASSALGGIDSWSKAFHALVESILRDGEDLAVTISYSQIRHHVQRLGHLLDAVTQSRLVVLDAGSDTNVIVYRGTELEHRPRTDVAETQTTSHETTSSPASSIHTSDKFSPRNRHWQTLVGDSSAILDMNQPSRPVARDNMDRFGQGENARISVSGLRDWSNCIFGDPLMAEIFNDEPSSNFIRGFRQQPSRGSTLATTAHGTATTSSSSPAAGSISRISSPPPDDLIEDRENASIRLMLYECYHATVSIVKQFYRPSGPESTRREMEARRRLAAVLNKLAEVEDNPSKRPRTGSVDIWPSKKSKSDVGR